MRFNQLKQLLLDSKPLFSENWLKINSDFFQEDNLCLFVYKCLEFHENGIPENKQKPFFSEEITPKLDEPFLSFKTAISELEISNFVNDLSNKKLISTEIQKVPFEQILLVMGQRQTSATIKTSEGLPMSKKDMLSSTLKLYNKQISVGVRAWEKHTERSEDNFWGEIKGSPQQKLDKVKSIITNIINNHTWWNTFHHYKHEVVFEIRVESGHGMRWSKQHKSLIGFLEPFL